MSIRVYRVCVSSKYQKQWQQQQPRGKKDTESYAHTQKSNRHSRHNMQVMDDFFTKFDELEH